MRKISNLGGTGGESRRPQVPQGKEALLSFTIAKRKVRKKGGMWGAGARAGRWPQAWRNLADLKEHPRVKGE